MEKEKNIPEKNIPEKNPDLKNPENVLLNTETQEAEFASSIEIATRIYREELEKEIW